MHTSTVIQPVVNTVVVRGSNRNHHVKIHRSKYTKYIGAPNNNYCNGNGAVGNSTNELEQINNTDGNDNGLGIGIGNISNNISNGSDKGPLDTFPKQFITSMKTLFDILDDRKTGLVKFSDIEKGWQDDGCKGLPYGVIDSLRKVTPLNGFLTFERFCAGLKICLLRNQTENKNHRQLSSSSINNAKHLSPTNTNAIKAATAILNESKINSSSKLTAKTAPSSSSSMSGPIRHSSAPLLDIENPVPNAQWTTATTISNTAAIRPNNAIQAQQRAVSFPQLSPDSGDLDMLCGSDTFMPEPDLYGPPPKPPRSSAIINSGNAINKTEIRRVLQNWQQHTLQNWKMGILVNEMEGKDIKRNFPINRLTRGIADGGAAETSSVGVGGLIQTSGTTAAAQSPNNLYQKKPNIKKREPRRHTLQNGVDYNMLKRLKQFEEERDVLLQGLATIEKAKEWYLKQISNVQDKIKYLGRSHIEQWSEAHQERLDLQRARVLELNRHLSVLADSWERDDYPLHMNLAVRHGSYYQNLITLNNTTNSSNKNNSNNNNKNSDNNDNDNNNNNSSNDINNNNNTTVKRLKQQNRQLTDVISQKSDRLTALERENQSLIHKLVQLKRSCGLIEMNISPNTNNLVEDSEIVF